MATFTYIAADRSGTTRRGTISAANTHEAAELVRSKGLVLVNISTARSAGGTIAVRSAALSYEPRQSRLSAGGGIAVKDMSIFTSQLGTMLNAGLSITKSLDVQSKQLSNKKLRMITEDLKKKVESGLPLSTAMTDYPGAFSTLYTSMVMSGEGSGNLGNSLLKMATFLEREAELKRKIKSATSYPLIVISASVPLISCLEMVGGTMGNSIVSATIDRVIDSIKSGTALSAAMAETQFFTPMVIQMTAVGEESGSLETMLGKVATFYQAEVDSATENLTNAINPILMIVVGGLIGWVLISLYLPIFTMAGGIS